MGLRVKIVNPDELVYEGTADYVIAPGVRSDIGILPGHTPMYAELTKGKIFLAGTPDQVFEIEVGILRIRGDVVTILVGLE